MAALIFIALALGVWATQLPRGDLRSARCCSSTSRSGSRCSRSSSCGSLFACVVGAPAYAEPLGRLVKAAAEAGHLALYALMIAHAG